MRHERTYLRLVNQYLDDQDDDANTFVFSDNEFWSIVGIDSDICQTYDVLTAQDFADAMAYINFHYQVAYRNNKRSGNHDDFCNFVGSRHFLLYYHLWLCEAPHLLNFAVPLLPIDIMRQTTRTGEDDTTRRRKTNKNSSKRSKQSREVGSTSSNNTAAAAVAAAMDQQQHDQTIANVLQSLDKSNQARIALMQGDAAPRRERAFLRVFQDYKGQLKAAKSELRALETAGYKSDDSDIIDARKEVVLCKRKRDEAFLQLNNTDMSK